MTSGRLAVYAPPNFDATVAALDALNHLPRDTTRVYTNSQKVEKACEILGLACSRFALDFRFNLAAEPLVEARLAFGCKPDSAIVLQGPDPYPGLDRFLRIALSLGVSVAVVDWTTE